jgi:hypothetical protein
MSVRLLGPEIVFKNPVNLRPFEKNPKIHTDTQVEGIAASIREFGFNDPVGITSAGLIIEGHGRVLAAMLLKMDLVPCILLDHMNPDQLKAYLVAHNKLNQGPFDTRLLQEIMGELNQASFNLDVTGFDEKEVALLLNQPLPGHDQHQAPPDNGDNNPDLAGEPGAPAGGPAGFVIQFNIVFDNQDQQGAWFRFVRYIKSRYADSDTLGERLVRFIQDNGYAKD